MTILGAYKEVLVNLNKVEAPAILIDEFNSYWRQATERVIEALYLAAGVNQDLDDRLMTMKETIALAPSNDGRVDLGVSDYLHILKCKVSLSLNKRYKWYKDGTVFTSNARRLTSDYSGCIAENAYFKPSVKNVYYSLVKSVPGRCVLSIQYGQEDMGDTVSLDKVEVDYIKRPDHVELRWEDIEMETDLSAELNMTIPVCYDIIKQTTQMILESTGNPRLQTYAAISNSNTQQQAKN